MTTPPPFPHGETIVLHRRVALPELDEYGMTQYRDVDQPVAGCALWPQSELEILGNRDQTSTTVNCAVPASLDVDAIDAVTWRGQRYEVDAEAKRYLSPLTGRTGPTVLNLKRVEG